MKMIIWFLSVVFFLALPCFSQETEQDTLVLPSSDTRFEFPDDEYIRVPRRVQQTSPAYSRAATISTAATRQTRPVISGRRPQRTSQQLC